MDDDLKKWLPWIGGAAVLLIVVAIFFLTRGGGDQVAATTTTGASTTTLPASTTSEVTTTVPDTTTLPPTTTTLPPTTTTLPPTTTTEAPTTTTLPPTTTTIPDEPGIGELVLLVDGVQVLDEHVDFGMNDDVAVGAVTASLGPNTEDTGWVDSFSNYGTCSGDEVRGVEWGSFVMLFTKADTAFETGGAPHFFSYYYTEPAQPDFMTLEMLEIGDTVADLKAAYDGPDFVFGESELTSPDGFWSYQMQDDDEMGLWGYTTGITDADTVTSINGGLGCGE